MRLYDKKGEIRAALALSEDEGELPTLELYDEYDKIISPTHKPK